MNLKRIYVQSGIGAVGGAIGGLIGSYIAPLLDLPVKWSDAAASHRGNGVGRNPGTGPKSNVK